jgi:hypothetical protein
MAKEYRRIILTFINPSIQIKSGISKYKLKYMVVADKYMAIFS